MICESEQREPWERLMCGCQLPCSWLVRPSADRPGRSAASSKKDDDFCGGSHNLMDASQTDSTIVQVGEMFSDKNLVNDGGGVGCCGKPIKVGEQWLLCGKKKSRFPFHCMVGPDWPMVVLVYTLIVCAHAVVLGLASNCLGWPVLLVGLTGCCILLTAYTTVACTDPGIVYKELEEHQEEQLQMQQFQQQQQQQLQQKEQHSPEAKSDGLTSAAGKDEEAGFASDPALSPMNQGQGANSISPSSSPASSSNDVTAPILKRPNLSGKQLTEMVNGVACKTTIECGQCNLQRPYSARHCVYCGVCVEELDHHCPVRASASPRDP